jgi:hypothetical protein
VVAESPDVGLDAPCVVTERFDDRADGSFNRATRRAYDEEGTLLETLFDGQADGVWDSRTTEVEHPDGYWVELYDLSLDGTLDGLSAATYDTLGRLERVDADYDGDGLIDAHTTHTWEGDRETVEIDWARDGVIEHRLVYPWSYSYDAAGALSIVDQDDYANDVIDLRATYTRDALGRRLSEDWDREVDGDVDWRTEYTIVCGDQLPPEPG